MSDNAPTVGGDVSVLPSDANGMTEAQVMESIEGLLDDRQPKKRQPRTLETRPLPGDRAAETEQGSQDPMPGPEDPATSEEEEEDAYEPDLDPVEEGEESGHQGIEPPDSWIKAEDKEVFRALPPEAQAVVARRESEQNAAFTRKTQEVAETRKALESAVHQNLTASESYANNLQQLLFVAAPEAEEFSQIDWQRLAQDQPADYVRLSAKRDALRGRIGGIQQELQRVAAQSQQAQAYQFQETVRAEQQRLVEALPEFADPEKGPRKIAEMRQWLNKKGFNDQEISQVVDHRVLLVVEEAMQADRARRVRQQAETKRTNGQTPVQPPGAPRQRGDTQAAQRRAQKMDALKRSGSEKDAIGYLMEIL